jgi:NADPH:quinone reductase-like Zn-dependent oxidoreductase
MKAAVVTGAGVTPIYSDFDEPLESAGFVRIEVDASALSHVTRSRAAGTHYSSSDHFPFVAGVDGVGRRDDGARVYFFGPQAPWGGLAQSTLVPETQCIALPDGLDAVAAAAMAIPGMSSWAALVERAKFVAGETVLVHGATGASGRLAVQVAKHLGAAKVIATGRHVPTLEALTALGADSVISLDQDERALAHAFEPHFDAGVDIVLDYVWGPTSRALLMGAARALPDGYPMRFVQIGSIGGDAIELPSAILRSSAITLLGSGIGSVPFERLLLTIDGVLKAAVPSRFNVETRAVPLAEIASNWSIAEGRVRTVFTT